MTIDSAVIEKSYQDPNIVRPRPTIFIGADGSLIVQEEVPPIEKSETQENKVDKKNEEFKKRGSLLLTGGIILAGYIVFKIIKSN